MSRRRQKLVKPGLQFKFMLAGACMVTGCLMLQSVALALGLQRLADQLPHDGTVLLSELTAVLWTHFWILTVLVTPLCMAVGLHMTFRVAGPLHRLEDYLRRVIAGEQVGPCRLRRRDDVHLHELCALVNRVTASRRVRRDGRAAGSGRRGATPETGRERRSA